MMMLDDDGDDEPGIIQEEAKGDGQQPQLTAHSSRCGTSQGERDTAAVAHNHQHV